MAQRLETLAVLLRDLSLVPSSCAGWLMTTVTPTPGGSVPSSGPQGHRDSQLHTVTYAHS